MKGLRNQVLRHVAFIRKVNLRFYQRLLAFDEQEASEVVHSFLQTGTLDELYGQLLITALSLAERGVSIEDLHTEILRKTPETLLVVRAPQKDGMDTVIVRRWIATARDGVLFETWLDVSADLAETERGALRAEISLAQAGTYEVVLGSSRAPGEAFPLTSSFNALVYEKMCRQRRPVSTLMP